MDAPAFVRARAPADDQLEAIRLKIAEAHAAEAEIQDYEDRLKTLNKRLNDLQFVELPELMDAAGVSAVTLPRDGNSPAIEAKAAPYYRANIAANWDEERRQEAFSTLKEYGAEDLIKTEVVTRFSRGNHDVAEEFFAAAQVAGQSADMNEAVPHTTLTAWLKDSIENRRVWPPLDKIGATVGRKVSLKVKEE